MEKSYNLNLNFDSLEKEYLEKKIIEKNNLAKKIIEKNNLEKNYLEKNYLKNKMLAKGINLEKQIFLKNKKKILNNLEKKYNENNFIEFMLPMLLIKNNPVDLIDLPNYVIKKGLENTNYLIKKGIEVTINEKNDIIQSTFNIIPKLSKQ